MWKLYEIFKVLKIQKRIVSGEIIRGNTVLHGKLLKSSHISVNKGMELFYFLFF